MESGAQVTPTDSDRSDAAKLLLGVMRKEYWGDSSGIGSLPESSSETLEQLATLAESNRLTGMLDAQCSLGKDQRDWRIRIASSARRRLAHSIYAISQLQAIIQGLDSVGVKCMPFKGPALALVAYPNLNLREFGDLDILVRQSDVESARRLLETLGFRSPFKNQNLHKRHHVVYLREDNGFAVELHWALAGHAYPRYRHGSLLWDEREEKMILGASVAWPTPERLYVYLCTHAFRHDWERLQWLRDLPFLVRAQGNFDWNKVRVIAKDYGALRTVEISNALVAEIYGIEALSSGKFSPPVSCPGKLIDRIFGRLLAPDKKRSSIFEIVKIHLHGFDTWSDTLRFVLVNSPASEKDRAAVAVPAWMNWLYPLIRPVRLMIDYRKEVLRRRRNSE